MEQVAKIIDYSLLEGTSTVRPFSQFLNEGTQSSEGNSEFGAGPAVRPQTAVEAEKAVVGVSRRAVQGGKDGEIAQALKRQRAQKLICQTHPSQQDWGPGRVLSIGRLSLSLETLIRALTGDSDHMLPASPHPPTPASVDNKWRI